MRFVDSTGRTPPPPTLLEVIRRVLQATHPIMARLSHGETETLAIELARAIKEHLAQEKMR